MNPDEKNGPVADDAAATVWQIVTATPFEHRPRRVWTEAVSRHCDCTLLLSSTASCKTSARHMTWSSHTRKRCHTSLDSIAAVRLLAPRPTGGSPQDGQHYVERRCPAIGHSCKVVATYDTGTNCSASVR